MKNIWISLQIGFTYNYSSAKAKIHQIQWMHGFINGDKKDKYCIMILSKF